MRGWERFAVVVAVALALLLPFLPIPTTRAMEDGAEGGLVAFRGARLLTAEGPAIDDGVLVIKGSKIVAVGASNEVEVPNDARVVDVKGKVIIPGLVDTHSHIGIYSRPDVQANSDGNEGSGAVQSGLRALDAINPDDPGIRMAMAGGVTTVNIMPGSGNVIGGQTLYVKLRGQTVEQMKVEADGVLGGLKMANGENPKRFNFDRTKSPPSTRMKLAAMQREEFVKAREYQKKWADFNKKAKEDNKAQAPERDVRLEPLVEVLERKRTVHFHSHRADDLITAMRLAREFGFELVIQHGTEGYRVLDELLKDKIPVSLTLIDSPGGKLEVSGLLEENAAILDRAGVKVAINTDDSVTESRFFLRTGSIAVRGGMSEDAALRALSLHGAQMLHLDHRLGSLKVGKDADFVVLSGAPFSVYTRVLQTYIDGVKMFDHTSPRDLGYQVGGFALADARRVPAPPPPVTPASVVRAPSMPNGAKLPEGSPERLAVLAGRLYPVAGEPIEDGVVLIDKGKITAVGRRGDVAIPPGTPVLTAAVVTPGLVDAHTSVGLSGALNIGQDQDQDETSDPNQADLRVIDGLNPAEPLLEFLTREGVTTIHAVPGRHNVIAGQTGVFHTHGRTIEGMTMRFPASILINLGEIPKQAYGNKGPTTRMGTASLVRNALAQAQAYQKKQAGPEDKRPAANGRHDALVLALEHKIPLIFAAQRADDLQTALRIGREFGLQPRLDLAAEAYLITDVVAKAGAAVVVHPTMQRIGSMETYNSFLGNAAQLADKKIPLALGTGFEGYVPKTRVLRHEAAIAMVHGLGYDRALRAITLDAARLLGVADRVGSLEPGKAADLVLFDGDPFENKTHVNQTLINGRVIYDRGEYLKIPFARRALPLAGGGGVGCCLGQW